MESNGTTYEDGTDPAVVQVLEWARTMQPRIRIRIWYGDPQTGLSWGDSEVGYVGRSCGDLKIPIIVHNNRSTGGGHISERAIIRIAYANKKRRFVKQGHRLLEDGILYESPAAGAVRRIVESALGKGRWR